MVSYRNRIEAGILSIFAPKPSRSAILSFANLPLTGQFAHSAGLFYGAEIDNIPASMLTDCHSM